MKEKTKLFDIKEGVILEDIMFLHPNMMALWYLFVNMCYSQTDISTPVITSIIHNREGIISKSATHREGRAIDVSVKGWREEDILNCVTTLNEAAKDIAAISYSDHVPRAVIYHDSGYGPHIHLQVKR